MAGRHSPLGALNLDVIRAIMSFIGNKNDLFAVMLTCREIYPEAVKLVARMWARSLDQHELHSFYDFMTRSRNAPNSFTGLRALCLHWNGTFTQDEADRVEELVVRGKQRLRQLTLPCMDQIGTQDKLTAAVASLKNLKYLSAQSDRSGVLRYILSHLDSPLTQLRLDLSPGRGHDDPLLYIDNFAPTLEKLMLTGSTPSRADVYFPKLTYMHIMAGSAPQLSIFMTAFPNLTYLDLDGDDYDGRLSSSYEEPEHRTQNIAFQSHGHSWPSLKRLSGDAYALYTLGLQQKVEQVAVCPEDFIYDGPLLHWLLSLLPPLRPESLDIGLSDDEDVLALAFGEGCENLTKIDPSVRFSGKIDFDDVWDGLIEGMGHCQTLRSLSLSLDTQPYNDGEMGLDKKELIAMLECLKGLDVEDLKCRLKAVLPCLERTYIRIPQSVRRWV